MISRIYYHNLSQKNIEEFKRESKNLTWWNSWKNISAKAYNDSLNSINVEDPYSKKKHEEGRNEYARMLEVHEKIGHIQIPAIDRILPIYAGTSETVLQSIWRAQVFR